MYDLTIAIPTFNRSRHLERLLGKLIPACDGMNVEVMVSDNASTDDTMEVIAKFKGYNNFRASRNEHNLGFDRNILKLLNEAQGRFVWLFGDDDDLDLALLKPVINLVKNRPEIGLLFLDFAYNNECDCRGGQAQLITKEISQQEYIDKYLHKATFITLNILNVQFYRLTKIDPDCVTKEWIQVQILVNMAQKLNEASKNNLIVLNKMILPGWGNANYSVEYFWSHFVDRFAFTVDRAVQGLSLKKFKKNFYRLNIRKRFLTIGRDFPDGRVLDIYRRVTAYFKPPIFDRVLFWLSLAIFRSFGYANLKKAKDLMLGKGK